MRAASRLIAIAGLCLSAALCQAQQGLANTTLLIIRHAEKPISGNTLTPAGEARAQHYTTYFAPFIDPDGKKLKIDTIFAATDSANSMRPRLTVEPLSKAVHLPINLGFTEKHNDVFVSELKSKTHGDVVLISWRHGGIPPLLTMLGADAQKLIGAEKWPDDVYDWVIELHYDAQGKLVQQRLIKEPF